MEPGGGGERAVITTGTSRARGVSRVAGLLGRGWRLAGVERLREASVRRAMRETRRFIRSGGCA